MTEKKGFLFDNDGVLLDTRDLHWQSWEYLMEEDRNFSISYPFFINTFGKRNDRIMLELYPDASQEQRTYWIERKERLYQKYGIEKVTLFPGMEHFLKELKRGEFPRIIASSTSPANLDFFLNHTLLGEYFSDYVSGYDVVNSKPAPDIFLAAAKKIGMKPESCIVIEDAPAGIIAGKLAGCFVIGLETTSPKEELQEADLIYKNPEELRLDIVLNAINAISEK